jgi:hypothetical protein
MDSVKYVVLDFMSRELYLSQTKIDAARVMGVSVVTFSRLERDRVEYYDRFMLYWDVGVMRKRGGGFARKVK